jgi:monodictyphenone polyketide synthase
MTIYTPTSGGELDMGLPGVELIYFGNEFPKDDLEDLFRRIHNHSKDNNHFILTQFINEATLAIKDEIRRLPTEMKQSIPPFDTILRWAEPNELRNGLMCGAVDGVLLVVAQLAAYIGCACFHLCYLMVSIG